MSRLSYLYAKVLKKYFRGKAVKNCEIDDTAVIYSGTQIVNSSVGRYSYVGYDCDISNAEIGSFCSISANVVIGAAQHPSSWVSTSPVFENVRNSGPRKRFSFHDVPPARTAVIGPDVWIGRNAIVMGGVKVGPGCIIGSGAVVTKDLEPYGIYAGVPAKLIRFRFDKETIAKLLDTKWWELPDENIGKLADKIKSPKEFIDLMNSECGFGE